MNERQKEEARTSKDAAALDRLAKQYGRGVQEEVAKNPAASSGTLRWIAENQRWLSVIKAVIDHPNTTMETIEWLIKERAKPPSGAAMFFGDPSLNAMQARDAADILARCTAALARRSIGAQKKRSLCVHCGKELEPGSAFCNKCGQRQGS